MSTVRTRLKNAAADGRTLIGIAVLGVPVFVQWLWFRCTGKFERVREQGRAAFRAGVRREDSPFNEADYLGRFWHQGWDQAETEEQMVDG